MCIEHGGQQFEQFEQFLCLLIVTFCQRLVVKNPLKTKKSESTFIPNAPRFPKEHCLLEDSQALPVCPSGKSNV
jgi:hypothetical protein